MKWYMEGKRGKDHWDGKWHNISTYLAGVDEGEMEI